ncbi:unnamed protein product [Heterobilharzia americana]|nr:unnamed protein product [Heterobilharzia americana]CAH8484141.1 unnamed protein product [Heterobilharzia americana]
MFSPIYSLTHDEYVINHSDFVASDRCEFSYNSQHLSQVFPDYEKTYRDSGDKSCTIHEAQQKNELENKDQVKQFRQKVESAKENDYIEKPYFSYMQKQATPDLLLRTKNFIMNHHSCIDVPPAHWISAPVALNVNHNLNQSYSSMGDDLFSMVNQTDSLDSSSSVPPIPKCCIQPVDYTHPIITYARRIEEPNEIPNSGDAIKDTAHEVSEWINKMMDE